MLLCLCRGNPMERSKFSLCFLPRYTLHSHAPLSMQAYSSSLSRSAQVPICTESEFLLFLEEHPERDDGSVDEAPANDRHDCCHPPNLITVRKKSRKCCIAIQISLQFPFPSLQLFLTPSLATKPQNEENCSGQRQGNVPTPIKTRNPVQNLPKSTTALLELSTKSSGLAQRPQIQFGKGART